jgi:tRNA A-37 threonylcarbamoyl transferase component Bud32
MAACVSHGDMTTLNPFNPSLMMEDCISTEHSLQDKEQRNRIIARLLANPLALGVPFPFINRNDLQGRTLQPCVGHNVERTGFVHYMLDRPNACAMRENGLMTPEMFRHAKTWLCDYLWFSDVPCVHGDLTDSNLLVNGNSFFIIDFQPGFTVELDLDDLDDYNDKIETDINDFIQAVININSKWNPSYNIEGSPEYNWMMRERDSLLQLLKRHINLLRGLREQGIDGEKLRLFIQNSHARLTTLSEMHGGKRKQIRKSKRKSKRKTKSKKRRTYKK